MNLSELMETLTATQREAVLSYARQLAQSNIMAASRTTVRPTPPDNKSKIAASTTPQTVAEAKDEQGVVVKPASPNTSWFIDGRVRRAKPASPEATLKNPTNNRILKCARCGRLIDESDFESHWQKAHPAPKKAAKVTQPKKAKGKKKKRKTVKASNSKSITPRLVQGGLCSPR
jgi:hypothetical protein